MAGVFSVQPVTYEYRRVRDNSLVKTEDDFTPVVLAIIIGLVVMFFLSALVIIIALLCYIGNYIFPRIAFSAVSQKELLEVSDGGGYVQESDVSALRLGKVEVTARQALGFLSLVGSLGLFALFIANNAI